MHATKWCTWWCLITNPLFHICRKGQPPHWIHCMKTLMNIQQAIATGTAIAIFMQWIRPLKINDLLRILIARVLSWYWMLHQYNNYYNRNCISESGICSLSVKCDMITCAFNVKSAQLCYYTISANICQYNFPWSTRNKARHRSDFYYRNTNQIVIFGCGLLKSVPTT